MITINCEALPTLMRVALNRAVVKRSKGTHRKVWFLARKFGTMLVDYSTEKERRKYIVSQLRQFTLDEFHPVRRRAIERVVRSIEVARMIMIGVLKIAMFA